MSGHDRTVTHAGHDTTTTTTTTTTTVGTATRIRTVG